MANRIEDLQRLCIHTITTKPWSLEEAVENYSGSGVSGVTVWRDALAGRNPRTAGQAIRDAGMDVVSLCRGGFFPAVDAGDRKKAVDENKRIVDEAAELGAPLIVLVCGADPEQDLAESRRQIEDGIRAVLPQAEASGVKLGVEPLHPMYADSRSAINTLEQANDLCEKIGSDNLGVVVDVYHLWWDSGLEQQIRRSGENGNLMAFHICDWKTPTEDLLNDRGLMGEGCIPVPRIRGWMEEAGFGGYHEVEIFSNTRWLQDQKEFLEEIVDAYRRHA